jgi:hypothetical protein
LRLIVIPAKCFTSRNLFKREALHGWSSIDVNRQAATPLDFSFSRA